MTKRESYRRFAWATNARRSQAEALQGFRPARGASASRAVLLFGTALGCSIAVFATSAPTKAFAADECGPNDPGADTNTCTAGVTYPTIEYLGGDDLTIVLPGPGTVVTDGVVQTGSGSQTLDAQNGTIINGVTDTAVIVSAFNGGGTAYGIATVTVDDVSAATGFRAIDVDGATAATLTVNGVVDTDAAGGNTVEVTSVGNVVVVNNGSISALNAGGADVISASSSDGTINVFNGGYIYGEGVFQFGIDVAASGADAADGANVTNNGGIVMVGDNAFAIDASASAGTVNIVNNGSLTTDGDNAIAINADTTTGGVIIVNNGDITTGGGLANGDGAFGIDAVSSSGAVAVVNSAGATVTTSGDGADALRAYSDTGTVNVVNAGDIFTSGANAYGVYAYGDGAQAVTVTNSGTINTTGDQSYGVYAYSDGGGAVTVSNTGSISTDGADAEGVYAYSSGAGTVSVTNSGTIATYGDSAYGVYAESSTGAVSVTNSGVISTDGAGSIGVGAFSDGAVTVTNSGAVRTYGDDSYGIWADSDAGALTINGGGDVRTEGSYATAIAAYAAGNITIVQDDITTGTSAADLFSYGVYAVGDSNVSVTVGDVVTNGAAGVGVWVEAGAGSDASITFGSITTNGGVATVVGTYASYGVVVTAGDDITVNGGTIDTDGLDAVGLDAVTYNGDVTIVLTSVQTDGANADGVYASATGDTTGGVFTEGNVSITVGSATTTGANADGVDASSVGGDISVTSSGTISTTGAGSYGVRAEATRASFTNDMGTPGDPTDDVTTYSAGNDVVISTATVTTTGAGSTGIYGFSEFSDVTITAGTTTATGAGANAIEAFGGDDVTVTVSVLADSAQAAGVSVTAGDTVTINTGAGDIIEGATVGLYASSGGGTTVNNAGIIRSSTAGNFAIDIDGAPATINNSGTITGRIDLTGSADTVANSGTFTAVGTSEFGGAADVFTNTGVVTVFGGTATFNDLETFNNASGDINLVDGAANDIFDLSDATFNGGVDSRLLVDVDFEGTPAGDLLRVGTAGTGTTSIVVSDISTGGPVLNFTGVRVVDAAVADGDEFVIGNPDQGFVFYGLRFDAATDDFFVQGLPDTEVFDALGAGGAASDFWNRSADAWSARMMEVRDAQWGGSPTRTGGVEMWMQGYAGGDGFDDTKTFTSGTFTTIEDVSVENNFRGFQMGFDTLTGGFLWGLTAGFADQETKFADGNSFDIDGFNLGAYAAFVSGPFFLNGLVKGDFYEAEANFGTIPLLEEMDGSSWGAKGEAGFRFGGPGLFLEPMGSIAWSDSELDGFSGAGGTITYGETGSLIAKLGARLGGTFGAGPLVLTPYIGGYRVDERDGENEMTFATAGDDITLTSPRREAYNQVEFGVTAQTFYGLEGFLKGEANMGDEAEGYTTRLGVRWRW